MAELDVTVIAANSETPIPVADAWVMLDSLPNRLGVTLENLPAPPAYLRAPDARRGLGAADRGRRPHRRRHPGQSATSQ